MSQTDREHALQVKADLDQDYRARVAQGAKEFLEGADEPEIREIEDLYRDDLEITAEMFSIPELSEKAVANDIRHYRRQTQAQIIGMRLGVEPDHLLELVKLLEGFEG